MHRQLLILLVVAGCKKSNCEAAVDEFLAESDKSAASIEKLCPDLDQASLSCIVRARDYPSASRCVLDAKLVGPTVRIAPSKLRLCDEATARYRELTRKEFDRNILISQCEEKGIDAFECIRKAESPAAAQSCVN